MKHLKWLGKSAATFWIAGCGIATAQQAPPAAPAQSAPAPSASAQTAPTPMAWRLECLGDGKVLECQTMQSLFNRDDGKMVVLVSVRLPAKAQPMMLLQLPLGL